MAHLKALSEPNPRLRLEYPTTTTLIPNARSHPAKQVARLGSAIRSFGFGNPLIIDEDAVILVGTPTIDRRANQIVRPAIGLSADIKREV
jgi:hypothetical protein